MTTNYQSKYDIVIIGAGMGGLTAAALLSRAGFSVCVLEMASQAGGYLAGFHRNRFRFDTAIHWLNQCNEGGMIYTVFESIGTDYPKTRNQRNIKRWVGDNHNYLLTNNPDELKEQLQKEFPHEKDGITRFFKTAKQIGLQLHEYGSNIRSSETMTFLEKIKRSFQTLKFVFPFIPHVRFSGEEGLRKGLNRYFKDPKLHQIFSTEPDMLSCLIPIGFAYFSDFQNPPIGGGQSFIEWLLHVTKQFETEVFYHTKVTKIIVENGEAKGVEVDHRGEVKTIASDYVLASCDIETLYEKMLPETAIPQQLKTRLREADLYHSSLTISVALDCPPEQLGFAEELVQITRQNQPKSDHSSGDPEKSEIIILAPSLRDSSMAPENNGTITIFMPAKMTNGNFWNTEGTDADGNYVRGEAYKKLKTEYAEILIRRVEEKIAPELRKHILFYHVATPVTHYRYTGNKDGTMMGARPGKKNMQAGIAHYQTPVKKLILSGHWAELGGGVPIAAKAGLNASLIILKKEKPDIFKAYTAYIDKTISAEQIRTLPIMKQYINNWSRQLTPAELLAIRRKSEE